MRPGRMVLFLFVGLLFLRIYIRVSALATPPVTRSRPASSPLNLALLQAVREGNTARVYLLLEQGADPNSQTANGEYAISIAGQSPVTRVIQAMTAKGVCVRIEKHRGYKQIASALIARGARVNVHNLQQWTPLDQARSFDEADVVTLLEKAGAH